MIVVGTDGSVGAELALATALSLAGDSEPFVIVTGWQELRGDFGLPYARLLTDSAAIEREWADKTASAAAEIVRAAGHPVDAIVQHGKPARMICDAASETGARLVVVGSTGWGPIEGMLMGSVSAGVLHNAPCTVVTVRPPRSS
jgi:nucleotide-binding universal stress UspA family protein